MPLQGNADANLGDENNLSFQPSIAWRDVVRRQTTSVELSKVLLVFRFSSTSFLAADCPHPICIIASILILTAFSSITMASPSPEKASKKPIVLQIGDPVKWNKELFAQFSKDFTVIRPSLEERQRDEFMKALKEKRWGDFSAIFRPFWNTGGEMGRWDRELIPLVPESCKIFASAGAGFDWADVDILAARGTYWF